MFSSVGPYLPIDRQDHAPALIDVMAPPSPEKDALIKIEEAADDDMLQFTGRKEWHPAVHILIWVVFSNTTILFNKWIMDSAGFRYPVILTCWHLVFTTVATQVLAHSTSLLDSRHRLVLTKRLYARAILPIGLFYSSSLVLSNVAYLHLSVAFIQMLKATAPIAMLLASWAWRVADPSLSAFLNILIIVFGAALSSLGDVSFSLIGFTYQILSIVFEAVRVVMIQFLLSDRGFHIEPLVGLYYYAPVCALLTGLVAFWSEVPRLDWDDLARVGPGILVLNAAVAFMVNVTSVLAIERTSGLVMTLTGIFKNVILIVVSAVLLHTEITRIQCIGYSITLIGLIQYSIGYEQLSKTAAPYVSGITESGRNLFAATMSRKVLTAALLLSGLLLFTITPPDRLHVWLRAAQVGNIMSHGASSV